MLTSPFIIHPFIFRLDLISNLYEHVAGRCCGVAVEYYCGRALAACHGKEALGCFVARDCSKAMTTFVVEVSDFRT